MALSGSFVQPAIRVLDADSGWRPKSTFMSIGWLTLAQVSSGGCLFVASILRARYLTLPEFGLYALATTIAAFLAIVADFGLSVLQVRDLSRASVDARRYLGTSFLLTVGLSIAAAAGVIVVSVVYSRDPQFLALARVFALAVLLTGLSIPANAFLRSRGRTWVEAAGKGFGGTLMILLTLLVISRDGGAVMLAWTGVAAALVTLVVPLAATIASLGWITPRIEARQVRRLGGETAPLGVAMLFTAVYFYADALMLGAYGERDALARYNACYFFITAVLVVIMATRTGFMPAQSRGHAGEIELTPVLRSYLRLTMMLALPLAVVGPLVAAPLLRVLYGPSFVAAAPALRLLFVTGGVMFFSAYVASNLLLVGRQRAYLLATMAGAATNVALNLVLIPRYSLNGAAAATLIAEVAVLLFLTTQDRHTAAWLFKPPRRHLRPLRKAA